MRLNEKSYPKKTAFNTKIVRQSSAWQIVTEIWMFLYLIQGSDSKFVVEKINLWVKLFWTHENSTVLISLCLGTVSMWDFDKCRWDFDKFSRPSWKEVFTTTKKVFIILNMYLSTSVKFLAILILFGVCIDAVSWKKRLRSRPFVFLLNFTGHLQTISRLKFCSSASISTNGSTDWQCWVPHCFVIGWKGCKRMKFSSCCCVPVN